MKSTTRGPIINQAWKRAATQLVQVHSYQVQVLGFRAASNDASDAVYCSRSVKGMHYSAGKLKEVGFPMQVSLPIREDFSITSHDSTWDEC